MQISVPPFEIVDPNADSELCNTTHTIASPVGTHQITVPSVEAQPTAALQVENLAGYWCPIMALARFPNTYIGGRDKALTLRLLADFFHEEKFWCRTWKQ